VTGYDALEELLAELPVMRLPKPRAVNSRTVKQPITVVLSDLHFGCHDEDALSIALQIVRDAKPSKVVLNGDTADLLAVSSYPKDWRHTWSLADERRPMHEFLWQLRDTAPQAEIVDVDGNHSGDGVESRWHRYLSDRIGELASLPDVMEKLSYKNVFHPEGLDIKVVPHEQITKGMIAVHGDVVRQNAGMSAKAMLDKWRVSLIMGHCHRIGATGYRVPAVGGQNEAQLRAYEGGCLCRLDPSYLSVAQWQQGLTLIRHDDEGRFGVEQILIHKGEAVSTTLGGLYRA